MVSGADAATVAAEQSNHSGATALRAVYKFSKPAPRLLPTSTTSASVRSPQYLDRHLANSLILKRVEYVPSFFNQLEAIAEGAAESRGYNELPSSSSDFNPSDFHRVKRHLGNPGTGSQIDIQSKFTAFMAIIQTAAATLEFQSSSWSRECLNFAFDSAGITDAKADGYAQLLKPSTRQAATCPGIAEAYDYFRDFLVWEVKSVSAAGPKMFASILGHAGSDFPWAACTYQPTLCLLHHGIDAGSRHELPCLGERMGPDAGDATLSLDVAPERPRATDEATIKGRNVLQQVRSHSLQILSLISL